MHDVHCRRRCSRRVAACGVRASGARPTSTSASRCRRPVRRRRSAFPRRTRSSCCRRRSAARRSTGSSSTTASDTTQGGHQHAQAHLGEQGRRDRRLDDHAELARDGRRRRRRRDADDLDGGVGAHRRSGESEDEVGVQDAAERLADGRRDRRAHEGERREDDGLHRLRRRVRRRLARRDAGARRRPPASRSSPRRSTTATTRRSPGQVLKLVAANPDAVLIARGGHARRDAAEGARRAQLQGQDLPDARRRESRLPARRRQGRQRHDPADRPDAGLRAAAGLQSDQEGRGGVHQQVRSEVRQGLALDVRRPRVGCVSAAVGARFPKR